MTGGLPRLGVVTIGQSPRVDLVPELLPRLGRVEVVERGALDDLGRAEIAALAPGETTVERLATRLADGRGVALDGALVAPHLRAAVRWVEEAGVTATLLVCTGHLVDIPHRRPLITAQPLVVHGVRGLVSAAGAATLGVVCPLPDQRDTAAGTWRDAADRVLVEAATPYAEPAALAEQGVARAAADLADRGADWIVLDCMGYSERMRRLAANASGRPVALARSVVARLAAEVIA
ncbi:hypothetical protein C1701_18270 [Actinoalloteichus sp. AHMU CJ021]|uniref:Protein AroM n=1 Tax=Actinoalloteichus caeruleus DSM 43889 TaxID=1120930 RepID=A0ABT1JPP2_ACTCY|nr:AroM family protein [Actinoalloteichus caeruleus]AUS79957.1 hypothetical protein C1701_18270 [Actinoalloteichus sp. AHMU CJ021]MCP2334139.1 protein AroM [Actinoalloteichus caeruleus DSM 43889]